MPTYEYACTNCGNRFEVFQRIDDDPLTVCERCGGALRKVFHPAGIVFKGSGFYATDSRKKAKASKTSSSEGGSGSETTGSKAGGSEKPA
jgi:putative FmdB family regulatory protein